MTTKLQLRSATVPHLSTKKGHGGAGVRTSENRRRFLEAYERTFGNVSASCEFAGISRRTYYRWIKSDTSVNQRFRRQIERIKPQEKFVDWVEGKLAERIQAGDTTAIIFALKTQGRRRGYNEREAVAVDEPPRSDFGFDVDSRIGWVLMAIEKRASERGVSAESEASRVLENIGWRLPDEVRLGVENQLRRKEK